MLRRGTPAFAARNIRTVATVGTRGDGRRDAAQTGASPSSRRGAESAYALWEPVPRGGIVTLAYTPISSRRIWEKFSAPTSALK